MSGNTVYTQAEVDATFATQQNLIAETLRAEAAEGQKLDKSANLSDISNPAAARAALGIEDTTAVVDNGDGTITLEPAGITVYKKPQADATFEPKATLDADVKGLAATPGSQLATQLSATYGTVVVHGSTAGAARPSGAVRVLWVGTVSPTNAVDGDGWLNTSTGDENVHISGAFQTLNQSANDTRYEQQANLDADIATKVSAVGSATKAALDGHYAPSGATLTTSPGKNLFDSQAVTPSAYWNNQTSGVPYPVAGWFASAKIPVTVGTTYTVNNTRQVEFFNGSTVVTGLWHDDATFSPYTFTVSSGVTHVGLSTVNANLNTLQMEIGSSVTSYQPFGAVVPRLLIDGGYADAQMAAALAGASQSQRAGITVYRTGNNLMYRSAWNGSLDIVIPINLAGTTPTAGNNVMVQLTNSVSQWVASIPQNTTDSALWPTPTVTLSTIQGAGDDNCPILTGWSYIGANHGWFGGSKVTMTGHGKTTADLGSTWTDGTRTYTLLRINDANTLTFGNQYTVSSGVVTGSTVLPAATLTHVANATNTANVTITGGVVGAELGPITFGSTVKALIDGRPVIDGAFSQGTLLTITETYQIVSYKGLIDWSRANIGLDPFANISSMLVMAQVSNNYQFRSGGLMTVGQTLTRVGEDFWVAMGVTQALQIVKPSGGSVKQYMPGVGTAGGFNFSTYADVSSPTLATVALAQQLVAADPATRMTQWAYDSSSVKKYGMMLGLLPVMDGKNATRRANGTDTESWFMSNTYGKNYPQLCYGKTLTGAGATLSGVGYRKYLPPDAPTEQVIQWGDRYWVMIDTPTANATAQVARVPQVAGRTLTAVGTSTLTTVKTFVSPEGVTYTNTAPGYMQAEASVDTSV